MFFIISTTSDDGLDPLKIHNKKRTTADLPYFSNEATLNASTGIYWSYSLRMLNHRWDGLHSS